MLVKKDKSRFFFYYFSEGKLFAIVQKFKTRFFFIVSNFRGGFSPPPPLSGVNQRLTKLMMMTLSAFQTSIIKGRNVFNKFHPPPHRPQLLSTIFLDGDFLFFQNYKYKILPQFGNEMEGTETMSCHSFSERTQCRQSFSQVKKQNKN